MAEKDLPPDGAPEILLYPEAKSLRKNIVDLTKMFGSERVNHDGLTATFQIDSQRVMTLRNITRNGEHTKGAYAVYWETLVEYEDGGSVQLYREYQFYGKSAEPYIIERAMHLDSDGYEVPFAPDRAEGMNILIWNRLLKKREADLQQFMENFDDPSFYQYQAQELEDLLGLLNASNLVACEDETA